jgi:glucokinase
MMAPVSMIAGVDIGGTKILAGAVGPDGDVHARARVATPKGSNPEQMCEAIASAVEQVGRGLELSGVGVGVAAYVNEDRSVAMFAPHLPFRRYPLRKELERLTGLPVLIENDANAAIWAESRYGVARGVPRVIGVTLGTGVGGAAIFDGHLYRGANGMAGEFGHLRVVPEGQLCNCGKQGCLEQYASGTALSRYGRELVAGKGTAAGMLYDLAEGDPERVTGPMVSEAARAGDKRALKVFRKMAGWLGAGLSSLSAALDPDLIVIGGGLVDAADLYLDRTREVFAETLTGRDYRRLPEIRAASLGAEAGFLGAADLAAGGSD